MKFKGYSALLLLVIPILLIPIVQSLTLDQKINSVTQNITNVPYNYVENNLSDVDSNGDKGIHSNFTAQQSGPDSIYDTLTEEDTGSSGTLDLNVDSFDATRNQWSKIGSSPYLDAQDQPTNYINLAKEGGDDGYQIGDFGFETTSQSGTINSVKLRIYQRVNDSLCPNHFYLYDGSIWNDVGSFGARGWQWDEIDVSTILNTWTKINNAKLYVQYDDPEGANNGPNSVDAVLLRVDYAPTNYELDLEVQWTNVDYSETNEELCTYAGTMGSENIRVDVWNGSAWQNLFADLTNGWNNVTVTSYLQSSTFTIRFKGGTETSDSSQDSWAIDATLLHVWS